MLYLTLIIFSVVKHNECAKLFDRFSESLRPEDPVKIYGNNLCATRPDKLGDVCQGDSGGSLSYQAPNGRYEVIGVVSYGFGCGSEFEGLCLENNKRQLITFPFRGGSSSHLWQSKFHCRLDSRHYK